MGKPSSLLFSSPEYDITKTTTATTARARGEERAAMAEKLFDGSGECSIAWRWRAEILRNLYSLGLFLTGIESIRVEDPRNANRSDKQTGENG